MLLNLNTSYRYYKIILKSNFLKNPSLIQNVIQAKFTLNQLCLMTPDELSTEAVKVFIVRSDPDLTEADVVEYCKQNFTGYKRPKYIEFRNELPKSNIGKILRRELREKEA